MKEVESLRRLGIGVSVIGGFLRASYSSGRFERDTQPRNIRVFLSLRAALLILPSPRNARRYVAAYSLTVYLQP